MILSFSLYIFSHISAWFGFPGGSVVKNLPASARDPGSIPAQRRSSGGGNGNPIQYSCLENPMDKEAGYSSWGHKESDMTDHAQVQPGLLGSFNQA